MALAAMITIMPTANAVSVHPARGKPDDMQKRAQMRKGVFLFCVRFWFHGLHAPISPLQLTTIPPVYPRGAR